MKKLSLLLLGFVFAFAGCKNDANVIGEWETRSLEINGIAQEICVSNITISKKSNNVYSFNGESGVNSFFGSAEIKGNSFSVKDDMGSTRMLGEPRAMEFERNFMQTLIEAKSVKVFTENNSEFLTIENKDKTMKLIFIKK